MADNKEIEMQDQNIRLTIPTKHTRQWYNKSHVECVTVSIPNADSGDKRPWEAFIVPAGNIHDAGDGKNMYMDVPADGATKLTRRVISGKTADGKNVYGPSESRTISNADLKSIIEANHEKIRNTVVHINPGAPKKKRGISITFSKKLMGEKFQAKNEKFYVAVKIPNADPADRSAWETFLLPADQPKENPSGKSVYVYLPAEGKTRLERQEFAGTDENGKAMFQKTYRMVPNTELKSMMEAYRDKSRESVLANLSSKKAEISRTEAPAAKDEKSKQHEEVR